MCDFFPPFFCYRAPVLPLECYHGNSYSDSVEVVRSDTGRIEGLHLRFLMDGQYYSQYITLLYVCAINPLILVTPISLQTPHNRQTALCSAMNCLYISIFMKGQPLNNRPNACPCHVYYSEVPLYYKLLYMYIQSLD